MDVKKLKSDLDNKNKKSKSNINRLKGLFSKKNSRFDEIKNLQSNTSNISNTSNTVNLLDRDNSIEDITLKKDYENKIEDFENEINDTYTYNPEKDNVPYVYNPEKEEALIYSSEILNPNTTLEDLDNIKKQNLVPDPNESNEPFSYLYIGSGSLVMILGLFDTIYSKRIYSLIFVLIGSAVLGIGIYKNKNFDEKEKRGRIIRSKLLTLPENFYVLYYVRVPESNDGINHVVIGPTGIYTILSQKFDAKEDKDRIKQENETRELISLLGDESKERLIPDDNPITAKFINPEHKFKFEHNNRIKQKVIKLSYELEDFLKENDLECPVQPYVGFVNQEVAVLNNPLRDEDYFIDELLNKIIYSKQRVSLNTVHKCAILLTQYSTRCSN